MNTIAQIVSAGAVVSFIASLQMKEKKNLLLLQFIANILFAVQYILLGAYMGAIVNLISVIRCALLYFSKKTPHKAFLYIFIAATLITGFVSFDGILSLIPVANALLYTVSTWQDNMKLLRYLFIVASVLWIIYNYWVGAYVAIISNCFEIVSSVTAMIRFRNK